MRTVGPEQEPVCLYPELHGCCDWVTVDNHGCDVIHDKPITSNILSPFIQSKKITFINILLKKNKL